VCLAVASAAIADEERGYLFTGLGFHALVGNAGGAVSFDLRLDLPNGLLLGAGILVGGAHPHSGSDLVLYGFDFRAGYVLDLQPVAPFAALGLGRLSEVQSSNFCGTEGVAPLAEAGVILRRHRRWGRLSFSVEVQSPPAGPAEYSCNFGSPGKFALYGLTLRAAL
jgi:hypothetical protein